MPFIGKAFLPTAQTVGLGVLFLAEARSTPTVVTIASNSPSVASVAPSQVTIPAGGRMLQLGITSGAAGTATLTLTAADLAEGDRVRQFDVVVGSAPTPSNAPVITAAPVGVSIVPLPGIGRLGVTASAPVTGTVSVQLVNAASGADRVVTVRTSNAAVVAVGSVGSSSTTVTLPAGSKVLPLSLVTSGTAGAVVITFEVDGVQTQMLVVVGDVPPSQQPAVTAPVIGVRVGL